jgi:long-chain acyl-CoA synthetase
VAKLTQQADKYGDKVACSYRDIVDVVEETKTIKVDGKDETKTWK